MNDDQLLESAKESVREEREAILKVLAHLAAIDQRRLYLERGYPSLFEMCTREFGYSAAAAMRRIEAMRLVREVPKVAEKIESGSISLSVAAQAQTFFRHERKEGKAHSPDAKVELIASLENLSSREVEKRLATKNPKILEREKVRFITEDQVDVGITIPAELLKKLDRLKGLWSHRKAGMTLKDLIELMTNDALKKFDKSALPTSETKMEVAIQSSQAVQPLNQPRPTKSGAVSAELNRAVWKRDRGMCSFVDARTKRRCCSTHFLQVDHIQPVSLGGESTFENLRILCGAHNRFRNEKCGPVH